MGRCGGGGGRWREDGGMWRGGAQGRNGMEGEVDGWVGRGGDGGMGRNGQEQGRESGEENGVKDGRREGWGRGGWEERTSNEG